MEHVYRETIDLRAADCDMCGAWRPDAILTCMQETAGEHSARFGLDRKAMDALGICWVLSRVKVDMKRTPRCYEKITVETYPLPQRHLFFPRVHVFFDQQGEEVGAASALWVLMDMGARRITACDDVSARLPRVQGLYNPVGMPGTVRMPETEAETGCITPRFSDLDLNRHVNNTRYMTWCQDALGIACMTDREIASFQINYDAEVLPGTQVESRLVRSENGFFFAGCDGDRQLFAIEGALRAR